MTPWIKVENGLPPNDEDVIVYHKMDDYITVGCFNSENISFYIEEDGNKFYTNDGWETKIPWAPKGAVTHWTSLPHKPPGEK